VADAEGSDVVADASGTPVQFRLNAPGRHMAMNALAALAAVTSLAPQAEWSATADQPGKPVAGRPATPVEARRETLSRFAAKVFGSFSPVSGRGARRRIVVPGGFAALLDESYNGNGASMRAALSVLVLQPAQRRIGVLGDMLELGGAGPEEHAGLAPDVTAAADLVFACGPLMRHLYDALPLHQRGAYADDSAALAPVVARAVAAGDAILVKGSLGSRMKRVVDALDAVDVQHAMDAQHAAEAAA
jgi:UDP-N-acetylmuramoyl-tripeptide--D-alanyl-D-alanine ligase